MTAAASQKVEKEVHIYLVRHGTLIWFCRDGIHFFLKKNPGESTDNVDGTRHYDSRLTSNGVIQCDTLRDTNLVSTVKETNRKVHVFDAVVSKEI
jgi:hypothetical protein